jgi:pimeloyl-ACP methyl ester carboxylesterase
VTALLTAAAIPKSIAGVVTAAAPHRACNLDDEQRAILRRVGRIASPSSRTGQMLYVGRAWLDEIEQDPERFDPLHAIAHVQCRVLVVHGSEDSTVDVQSARKLAEAGGERARVEIIAGASHTFNAPNPLGLEDAPPSATKRMMDLTVDFALWCAAAPSDS